MKSSMTSLFIVYLIFRPSFSGRIMAVSVNCFRWWQIEGWARLILS